MTVRTIIRKHANIYLIGGGRHILFDCGRQDSFPAIKAALREYGIGFEQILRDRGVAMILPRIRDPRFITLRRGGMLTDGKHRLLALWAAECAEHVLHIFEAVCPNDDRPRRAVEAARAWVRGEIKMTEARDLAGAAQGAAREVTGESEAARLAALSAGQAAVVAHVAAHELGAAAYAIRAVTASVPKPARAAARLAERDWQRSRLPEPIRGLVLDDQQLRNDICWFVFGEGNNL
ncbi:MAG: immunity protein Imm5 [Oscillospiraceae bacterium]|nr:immunity protein Imm5 [Oscillospiraceae bacterium]